jgi:uncharacterized protein (TIGR03118 family)
MADVVPVLTVPRARPRGLGRARLLLALAAAALLVTLPAPRAGAAGNSYRQLNLVSDIPGKAQLTDPNLVNPWGMAAGPATPVWAADNGTGVATIYPGAVGGTPLSIAPLVVRIPGGAPTGQVFNGGSGFVVSDGQGHSGPALFIFASEAGKITGWNPNVPPPAPSTRAQTGVTVEHAVYKGLAIASTSGGDFLYAANFHSGHVDVFNASFKKVHLPGGFRDPNLPAGFAPFGIQTIGSTVYVAYAKQDEAREDEVAGPGLGFVDAFDTSGHLRMRVASRGALNAPWGLALAPASGFGAFSGDLLVGNFGDGRINAFDPATGAFRGTLRHPNGKAIQIDGLWAIRFGNGVTGGPTDLLFDAGIRDEAHGLLGIVSATG